MEIETQSHAVVYAPLSKHVYPLWIKLFCYSTLFLFIFVAIQFWRHELPFHYHMNKKITAAKHFFSSKDYKQAIVLYEDIFREYPDFRDAKIRLAKAYFKISGQMNNYDYFLKGVWYLAQEQKYQQDEWDAIVKWIPTAYKEDFNYLIEK